jgi:hypothetical protein
MPMAKRLPTDGSCAAEISNNVFNSNASSTILNYGRFAFVRLFV